MKSTITDLPIELEVLRRKLNSQSQHNTLDQLILKANAGEYHDLKSPHANPKIICISQLALLSPFTDKIVADIRDCKYNETE